MPTPNPIYKTLELEKQYLDLYDSVLALWPTAYETMDVKTSFGSTHINASGSKDKPAMVLIPGFGANSTMWYANIGALSSRFRLYALDTPGQPGRSVPVRKLTALNSSDWIKEVLDRLDIAKPILVGVSLGGWLTLNFAVREPGRVNRIVVLDPASAFEGVSPAFFWHSLIPIMIHPTRAGLIRYFRWMTQGYIVNPTWGNLMVAGILNTRPQPPIRPIIFSDEILRGVTAPTLLLIGERSVIYDPQRAYRRAKQLIPGVQAEIIPNASHALIAEKSELVNTRILQFCEGNLGEKSEDPAASIRLSIAPKKTSDT